MKPRIFISAVTSELGTTRQLVANVLTRLGYDPVWQDIFGLESRDLRQMLRDKIDDCDGLIQLIGRGYGAEPPTVGDEFTQDGFTRVSYTQFEFLYARAGGKKTWLIFADEGCRIDHPLEQLDLPRDPTHPDPAGYQSERRTLQEAWRKRWKQDGHLHHAASSDTDLELKVERLKDEFTELRRAEQAWRRKVAWSLAAVAALVLLSVGVGMFAARQQQQAVQAIPDDVAKKTAEQVDQAQKKTIAELQKLYENPDVLTGTLKSHIRKRATEEINKARKDKADWRKIDEIEKRRDQALDRVEDLVKTIREGLTGDPDPVFAEAARLLAEDGVQEAIDYLESKQPDTLEQVDRIIDRQNQDEEKKRELLKRLNLEARLRETNLQWEKSLTLHEIVAAKAPNWFAARNGLGMLLLHLARFREAEPQLRAAAALASNPTDKATGLFGLAELLHDTNRLAEAEPLFRQALTIDEQSFGPDHPNVARDLNTLALLMMETNRRDEAERLMRRALVIDEQSFGPDHPTVAVRVSNLAWLLKEANRLAEAEPFMERALAIDEKSLGKDHPNVANRLNNLAQLLHETNRLVEAEPLMRRATAITEQNFGQDHPKVATTLSNLALLLEDTNRQDEAEPLMRRALAIDEQSYGAEHPVVAIRLNNLSQLLKHTNRQAEAETLMLRGLAIEEKSWGLSHPNVARQLSNLASLLQATNRMAEAEPLMRRALVIDEQSFGAEHPKVAIRVNNLAQLLQATNRLAEAEPLMRRALAIWEESYGPEHPTIVIGLNNLGQLLQATNRLDEAESLMRRCLTILHDFQLQSGHEHPRWKKYFENYRQLLEAMKLNPEEIEAKLREVTPE